MKALITTIIALSVVALWAQSQGQDDHRGPPPPRFHKVTDKGTLTLVPATEEPPAKSQIKVEVIGDDRVITANGIPDHKTGRFANRNNPNPITEQQHVFKVPAQPTVADHITSMRGNFGIATNGVPFDPGAGEFYEGEPGWQYEPLSAAVPLGVDFSHAHVQPTGKYHYHGLPTGLLDNVKLDAAKHSPQIGWAADGFPMYALHGLSDPKDAASPIKKLTSSYQLKKGDRPGGEAPGGKYDGTFVADYEYVAGSGDLDECNGRFTITPDHPEGIYAYFLTENWPVIPRMFRGTPSQDFAHGGGPGTGPGGPRKGGDERRREGKGKGSPAE